MKRPKLEELTLAEKIGQLLMVGQFGMYTKVVDGKEVLRDKEEIYELMSKYQYGSVWSTGMLYMVNAELSEEGERITTGYSKKIIETLQRGVRLPMLVGMDAESGVGGTYCDCTRACGAASIGAANDEQLTEELFAAISREVKAAGGNWIWSPVVDIANRLCRPSLGRTVSDDPEKIVRLSRAVSRGMASQKVATTAKHFPGTDPYEIRDSHFVPTMINISLDEWRSKQAKTFQGMIDAGVDTIMTGHIGFPAADDTMVNGHYLPATLSKKILQGILREEMGFEGVIITDGICMGGLLNIAPYEEILVMAINAGNDVLLGVRPHDFEIVEKAVLDGRIPMSRIDESAERVLKLKEKIGLFDDEKEEIDTSVQAPITAAVNRKIAEKSITLLKNKTNLVPVNKDEIKNVTIVCSSHTTSTITQLEVMKAEFENRGAKVNLIEDVPTRELLGEIVDSSDLVVFAAYVASFSPIGMPTLYDAKLKTYFHAFTYGKEKSVGISMGYPYLHHDFMAGADTFFNIYSPSPESQKAFVKALYGEIEALGESPVDIEPKLRYVYC